MEKADKPAEAEAEFNESIPVEAPVSSIAGGKRKEPEESRRESLEPVETPVFKKPEGLPERRTSLGGPGDGAGSKEFVRPPQLTVDTSQVEIDMDSEPVVPRTPANVRSTHRTELHAAVCAANVVECKRLLEEERHATDPQEEHGFTPLHNAAALPEKNAPRLELISLLLAHGADANRADNEGYTCLHWAAACGAANIISTLIEAGATPSQRSHTGETALHRAARLGRIDCVRQLAAACGPECATWPNHNYHSPLDVAGKAGKMVHRLNRVAVRRALLEAHPTCRTLLLHHPDCSLHITGEISA